MPIVKTVDGRFFQVQPEQEISIDTVRAQYQESQQQTQAFENMLADMNVPQGPTAADQQPAPAQPEQQPAAPANDQPADQPGGEMHLN